MLHKAMKLTTVCLISFMAWSSLTGCTPEPEPVAACKWQVPVNGYITLQPEFASFKLKLPAGFRYDPTQDCKYIRSAMAEMIWIDGKLRSQREVSDKTRGVQVRIMLGGFVDPNKKIERDETYLNAERYFVSIPHRKYPLILYPNSQTFSESWHPAKEAQKSHFWGVQNTIDPITKRPFLARCAIPDSHQSGQNYIDAAFFVSGDSKCVSNVNAIRAGHLISSVVEVWVDGAPEVDKINNAVQSLLESAIED